MRSPITIEKLRDRNREFFKAASFHGDVSYRVNEQEMTLTVKCKTPYEKRGHHSTYSIDKFGTLKFLRHGE